MNDRKAVVIGVGPSQGLGAALARRFAREGLKVYVAGRTPQKLEQIAMEIRAAGGQAIPIATDATVEGEVISLFDSVSGDPGELDIVVCNVDSNQRAPLLETSGDMFRQLWLQNAYAGFLVGREAARIMTRQRHGTLFFTGASASLRARPPFTAFAAAKSALRALAQGMAREFGPQGIHVVHVIIDGVINGERSRNAFTEFVAQKGADGLLDLDAIADTYWLLHKQQRSAWTHELDLRPFKEPF
ncbi:short-chain dehydrogenase/reductase SDR [Methylocaldum marinum]|jgi:NAD(P)-dependent dehydrogenase (short-subunit alcohol dehydrogenase family)|uniref:Short-chain dehydrogenase/reductase SDR n=1 Tax=Methylocaldum marinum TaxID=1432792 RepID=A0A286P406_9GAMM|nr:SDR family NAD(P)-dependent oxidoreductase [Methylocaldum marinum]BBA32378.1 short-chain dehydrogenase/reductase SDR [Methylocaldum marinum]